MIITHKAHVLYLFGCQIDDADSDSPCNVHDFPGDNILMVYSAHISWYSLAIYKQVILHSTPSIINRK